MASQGRFIVFEGGEGSGKDANIALLRERLGERSDIVYTREPGGTPIGEAVRKILMALAHTNMAVETELLLFLASRAQLVEEVVRPALFVGTHVIANRFALSTVAYQIYRKDRHGYRDFLDGISAHLIGDLTPHYILLDVPPEVGLARARSRAEASTRFDMETLDTHRKVREGYLNAVQAFPHTTIDANRPLAEVQDEVYTHVSKLLAR